MDALHAFLVEDSPVIAHNLEASLQELTPVVVVGSAADERGAVRWLRENPGTCDIVIVDIFLNGGSGLGVVRAAVELAEAPVLAVLTNYATSEIRQRCLDLGADRVFDKSTELDELIHYCVEVAESRRAVS